MEVCFEGKKAVVTGAGKGIGRDLVHLLLECGCLCVVAISRSASDLDSLEKEVNVGENQSLETIVADLCDPVSCQEAGEKAGYVDFLVNNAGINILEPFLEVKNESWDQVIDTNVKSIMIMSRVISKGMVTNGSGSIVNVSSQASQIGLADHSSYSASKGAIEGLTRVMAAELGPLGVRVNAILPTIVMTELGKRAWSDPEKSRPMLNRIPLKRFATPRDVSNVITFLLSDKAAMIHGSCIPVDGGFLIS